jgi:tripartite-type tricarboxylate transporter receptor subunit TctC
MIKYIVGALIYGLVHISAQAQATAVNFPDKPVRFLVPYTPGGNADLLVRLLSQKLSEEWKQSVIVENRPGASGTIAVNTVAKAKPDGHTMVLGAAGNLVVAHKLIKDLPYDVVKDLKAVSVIATPPFVLVTAQDSRFTDLNSLIEQARANPGTISFGSAGNGSANHLSGELMASLKNVKFMHVAYKGMGPAINDVMGGRVDFAFAPIPLVMPQIQAGKLRALGISGKSRTTVLPQVPTIAEGGVNGFESGAWFAVMVPNGTPESVVEKINSDIKSVMMDASFIEKLEEEGAVPIGNSPQEASISLQSEMAKWGSLIDRLNL